MQVRIVSAASVLILAALVITACSKSPKSDGATSAVSAASSAAAGGGGATSASIAASAPKAAASSGGTVDVCSLMTAAQASSINSVTYTGAASKHQQSGYDTCTYANGGAVDPIDIQALTVSVLSMPGCFSGLQQADGPGTKVAGLGDDAFGYEIGLDVKVGDRCLEVSGLTHAEFSSNWAPDTAMAKIILAKLS